MSYFFNCGSSYHWVFFFCSLFKLPSVLIYIIVVIICLVFNAYIFLNWIVQDWQTPRQWQSNQQVPRMRRQSWLIWPRIRKSTSRPVLYVRQSWRRTWWRWPNLWNPRYYSWFLCLISPLPCVDVNVFITEICVFY